MSNENSSLEGTEPITPDKTKSGNLVHQNERRVLDAYTVQQIAFEAAGITPEKLGEYLLQSLTKMQDKLEAQKIIYATHNGVISDIHPITDNESQLKAARSLGEMVMSLGGLRRNAPREEGPDDTHITVDLSGWTVQGPGGASNPPAIVSPQPPTAEPQRTKRRLPRPQ